MSPWACPLTFWPKCVTAAEVLHSDPGSRYVVQTLLVVHSGTGNLTLHADCTRLDDLSSTQKLAAEVIGS